MRTAKRGKVFAAGAVLLLALLAIFFVVQFFSQTRYLVQAFEFNVELSWSGRGNTVIFIPPFGEVRAATHWRPLALKITLLNVDLDQLTATLSSIRHDSSSGVRSGDIDPLLGAALLTCGRGAPGLIHLEETPASRFGHRAGVGALLSGYLYYLAIPTTLTP